MVVLTLLIKPHTKKKNMKKKTTTTRKTKSHNRKFHTTDFKPNDPYPRVRATQDCLGFPYMGEMMAAK